MQATERSARVGVPNIGRDTFAKARTEQKVNCQLYQELFDDGEEPLQRHKNRQWRKAIPRASEIAASLCSGCPIKTECGDGAAAAKYSGIAGGRVWRNGKIVG